MNQGKVRVRVCGILIEDEKVLLLKHEGLGTKGYIWSFPGGGMEFHENAEETLIREVKEETGLDISVDKFLFVNEYRSSELHAIELYFEISSQEGDLQLGNDPELNRQILTDISFFSSDELKKMDSDNLHSIFNEIDELSGLTKLRGYYKFEQLSK